MFILFGQMFNISSVILLLPHQYNSKEGPQAIIRIDFMIIHFDTRFFASPILSGDTLCLMNQATTFCRFWDIKIGSGGGGMPDFGVGWP